MSTTRIPRRTFLRGVGTAMALPLLEAMAPLPALAAPSRARRATRMAFLFVPNGIHMPAWRPGKPGRLDALPPTLKPLEKVKGKVTVLSGLAQHNAFALGDGAGDHARSAAAWLTGCHPRKTSGADIKNGISVDQLAAARIGRLTRFPSLEIGCERGAQAGNCDSGYSCAYSSSISWRTEATPVAKEVDPRLVFERLFGNEDAAETEESRVRRDLYRRSILDLVSEDAKRLRARLGPRDRAKLEEYFVGVREIEHRLARAQETGREVALGAPDRPKGIPADYGEHIRLMADMMVLAFQADLTRVATFMLANDGSNRSYRAAGVPEGHHDMSHHGGDPEKQAKVQRINTFHLTHLAYMLERMDSVPEGDGTLLDNAMVVYGAGISDGNRHNHDDLPILLAGRGGGTIPGGRHVVLPDNTPMANLFLSMLDRVGVPAESIGDSTGRLQGAI
ncbi:MAG: DUF1552 domain-containing protein [Chthonomonadales bacterium]|nr:DUF1552 domain-containing protein [Chthonomonadales bacterium]